MSMSFDKSYGFGFDGSAINPDHVVPFLKKHIDTIKELAGNNNKFDELIAELNGSADYDNVIEIASEIDGMYGFSVHDSEGPLIAEIMRMETGISFGCYTDMDTDEDEIMFEECYPWNMNVREKALTEDSLKAIIKVYMDELGAEGDVTYVSAECYG